MQISKCNWFCFAEKHLNYQIIMSNFCQNNDNILLISEIWYICKILITKNWIWSFSDSVSIWSSIQIFKINDRLSNTLIKYWDINFLNHVEDNQ